MKNKYQRKERKSNPKFEVVRGQELLVRVPLPMAELWAEMQAQVEELTGQAGLQILRAILENEVTRRVATSWNLQFVRPCSFARLFPASTRFLAISTPNTSAPSLAAGNAVVPSPHPRSRILSPSVIPSRLTSASPRSLILAAIRVKSPFSQSALFGFIEVAPSPPVIGVALPSRTAQKFRARRGAPYVWSEA